MNLDIELSFVVALETLPFIQAVVRPGTDSDTMPENASVIIIDIPDMDRPTIALASGAAMFRCESPALNIPVADHRENVRILTGFLGDQSAVKTAFSSATWQLVGIWAGPHSSRQEDNRWVSEVQCRIGVLRI